MPKPMGNIGKEKDSQVRLENSRKQRKWMLMREKIQSVCLARWMLLDGDFNIWRVGRKKQDSITR